MSRWHRLTPRTLAGKFLLFQLGVVGLVLLVAGLVSVRQATSQFASSSGDRVLGAAENVAGSPLVKRSGVVPNPATDLAPVAEATRIQSGATVVLLADVDRRDHHLDRSDAASGRRSCCRTTRRGPGGRGTATSRSTGSV